MDDGEVEFSDQDVFCASSSLVCDDDSLGMESFLDEILKSTHACTHTHTCNPPGPDKTHTHTCFHTHTQLFASPEEGSSQKDDDQSHQEDEQAAQQPVPSNTKQQGKKRPLGNREAVRKYREKKKAHAAYLEEQVAQLKLLNSQLLKRLQGQAALEAEVARLRALLYEFKGRIDAEIGSFPYKRPCNVTSNPVSDKVTDCSPQFQPLTGGLYLNTVSVPCDADVPCFHNESNSSHQQLGCDPVSESCQGVGGSLG